MLLGNPQSTLLDIDGACGGSSTERVQREVLGGQPARTHFHDMMEQARYSLDQKKRKEIYLRRRARPRREAWLELFQEYVIYWREQARDVQAARPTSPGRGRDDAGERSATDASAGPGNRTRPVAVRLIV
jgi:hypothetical protein